MADCYLEYSLKQCCCKCKYHIEDFEHCTTNPELRKQKDNKCICDMHKGFICYPPMASGGHSNWPEHSVGCELYTKK